ncbi:MAG: hypothetical protein JNK40_08925 [Chromatiales bacterium]|nr:hypothetical protein [Chromatiales bacterium]
MNRRTLHLITTPALAVLLLVTGLAPVFAADPPSFAGTWVLNTKKGENLGMMSAVKETTKIAQTPQQLKIESSAGFMGTTSERTVTYDLAGKPVNNEGPMGSRGDTVAKWDGNKLVVTWTEPSAIPGSKIQKVETRELSADGKEMKVTTTRGTKPPMVMVYERQK